MIIVLGDPWTWLTKEKLVVYTRISGKLPCGIDMLNHLYLRVVQAEADDSMGSVYRLATWLLESASHPFLECVAHFMLHGGAAAPGNLQVGTLRNRKTTVLYVAYSVFDLISICRSLLYLRFKKNVMKMQKRMVEVCFFPE